MIDALEAIGKLMIACVEKSETSDYDVFCSYSPNVKWITVQWHKHEWYKHGLASEKESDYNETIMVDFGKGNHAVILERVEAMTEIVRAL